MWPLWAYALVLAPVWWTISSVVGFAKNYQTAKRMDLPIVVSPVHTTNPIWLMLQPILGSLLLKFPFGLCKWVRYSESHFGSSS